MNGCIAPRVLSLTLKFNVRLHELLRFRADSHYTSRFRSVTVPSPFRHRSVTVQSPFSHRSVTVPSPFRQNGLCSHCPSWSVTCQNSTLIGGLRLIPSNTWRHLFSKRQLAAVALMLGGAVGCGIALQTGRSRDRFPTSLEFFIDILPAALWSWG
jgi:hypothetical protein